MFDSAQINAMRARILGVHGYIDQGRPAVMAGITLGVAYGRDRSPATPPGWRHPTQFGRENVKTNLATLVAVCLR